MAFLINLLISLFIFNITILILPIYAQNPCESSNCINDRRLQIRFPFLLKGEQDEGCGYPGFNVTCSSEGLPAIDLPFSGRFFIRNINYKTQKINLYDPNNCLPKKFIGLNLSSSPFMVYSYRNYSLFSCPFGFNSSMSYSTINCLSNSTNTVVAVFEYPTIFRMININCEEMYTISLPLSTYNNLYQSDEINVNDMWLTWNQPNCEFCEMNDGICELGNTIESKCSYPNKKPDLGVWAIMLMVTIIPTITCFLCVIFLKYNMRRNSQGINNSIHTPPQSSTTTERGLDDSTIQSYPIVIIGESNLSLGLNNKSCPICLSEFLTKEAVRFIPECTHCFHSNCIDEWLHLNRSCPVCRSSPTQVDSSFINVQ